VRTPAEAEAAGYRPCMRCRPERAPANYQVTSSPAQALAAHIDETLLMDETLETASQKIGLSSRQSRRLFIATYGVEPKTYATTRRLLFAKQLLQDTAMPVLQVAYAAGFGSQSRLIAQMRSHYGLTPAQLRKRTPKTSPTMTLRADYRPPFNWEAALAFIAGRATPTEAVQNNTYNRIIDNHTVSVRNVPEKRSLYITIPVELAAQTHDILHRVRALFDLDANPTAIAESLSRDPILQPITVAHPGLRVPGCWDAFEMLVRAIVGQQVSVAGATTIMRRLINTIGATPNALAASSPAAIASCGMPGKRAATIWELATKVQKGDINLHERDPQKFYDQLIATPGIGPWTAEYLRMRILHWPDAFPAGDLGLQKAHTPGIRLTEKQLLTHATAWQPWRSYAAMLLWASLNNKGA